MSLLRANPRARQPASTRSGYTAPCTGVHPSRRRALRIGTLRIKNRHRGSLLAGLPKPFPEARARNAPPSRQLWPGAPRRPGVLTEKARRAPAEHSVPVQSPSRGHTRLPSPCQQQHSKQLPDESQQRVDSQGETCRQETTSKRHYLTGVFGCLAMAHVYEDESRRPKHAPRAVPCVYLGDDPVGNACKVKEWKSARAYCTADVTFYPNICPYRDHPDTITDYLLGQRDYSDLAPHETVPSPKPTRLQSKGSLPASKRRNSKLLKRLRRLQTFYGPPAFAPTYTTPTSPRARF